jgi:hypothetical protein
MWKTNTSDVYLVTRTLGKSMKVSLHASGQCHVRSPDPKGWTGTGEPPRFLDTWNIDATSRYQFPFSVVIPEQELRHGEWFQHRDRGTIWLDASKGQGIEVALFLIRASGDQSSGLTAAGWPISVVDAELPDGRRLLVVAGHITVPADKLAELETLKIGVRAHSPEPMRNPRMVLLAGPDAQGTRKFVEAAGER